MPLSIRGRDILDPGGNPIILKGWNWGRWGTVQATDAADNVAQGANCVRLMLRWWGLYGTPDVDSRDDAQTATAGIDAAHLAILDQTVAWASAAGLWIILFVDSNCGQNGTQDADTIAYCDPTGSYPNGHNFWTDDVARAKFIAVWQFVANRYKNTPYLGLFEPLPEPNPPKKYAPAITAFYDEVMTAIRAVAPGIPFLLGADTYNITKVDQAYNPAWSDVVYTGNMFVHTLADPDLNIRKIGRRLQYLLNLRLLNDVPIFIQQMGLRSGDDPGQLYLHATASMLINNGVGYTIWQYRDSTSPDEYGAIWKSHGTWVPKADVIAANSYYLETSMTTIVEQVQTILAALASGESYNQINTKEAPVYPYIVFQRIVSTQNNSLSGPSDVQNTRLQIDVYDRTISGAMDLAGQVNDTLSGTFTQLIPISSFDTYEEPIKAFRVSQDFSVWSAS